MSKKTKLRLAPSLIYFGLLVVLALAFIIKMLTRETLSYDFKDPGVIAEWEKLVQGDPDMNQNGLLAPGGQHLKIFSPGPGKKTVVSDSLTWEQLPFVKINLKQAPVPRSALFFWFPSGNPTNGFWFAFEIPPGKENVLLDTQLSDISKARFPWNGRIRRFGFQFSQDVEIQSISLMSFPPITDLAGLFADQFLNDETFKSYSINAIPDATILGYSPVRTAGFILLIIWLIFVIYPDRSTRSVLIVGGILLMIVVDLRFTVRLAKHAAFSVQRAGWYASMEAEDESRFGKDFADLARNFEALVPPLSKVYFPRERLGKVSGETNWIEFLFYPKFLSVELQEAEYVFFYFPNTGLKVDMSSGQLVQTAGSLPTISIPVEVLYDRDEEIKLLKIRK